MELLGSNIKTFEETETPKKIPNISGNGNANIPYVPLYTFPKYQNNLVKILTYNRKVRTICN